MAQHIIEQLNDFKTFRFHDRLNSIVNLNFEENTNIEEFYHIRRILNTNRVKFNYDKNFDIKIL